MHQFRDISHGVNMVWQASEEGWLKINCDGSYVESGGCAGIGIVVRNDEGKMVHGICAKVKADCALVAELRKHWLLKKGLNWQLQKDIRK